MNPQINPDQNIREQLAGKLSQPLNDDDYRAIACAHSQLVVRELEQLRKIGHYHDDGNAMLGDDWHITADRVDAAIASYQAIIEEEK